MDKLLVMIVVALSVGWSEQKWTNCEPVVGEQVKELLTELMMPS